jgi:hypothetical protein
VTAAAVLCPGSSQKAGHHNLHGLQAVAGRACQKLLLLMHSCIYSQQKKGDKEQYHVLASCYFSFSLMFQRVDCILLESSSV